MKILTPEQLREVETQTVVLQDIEPIALMERAATAVFNWLSEFLDVKEHHFTLICGAGNNGGDGLALARLLVEYSSHATIYLMESDSYSINNLENQLKLKDAKIPFEIISAETKLEIAPYSIIVDAIFGYGLNRPIDESWKSIIEQINQTKNRVVAIDMPSGLYCEKLNEKQDTIVNATYTVTFQTPKISLLIPENQQYVGTFVLLNIGLEAAAIDQQESTYHFFTNYDAFRYKLYRNKFSHKYNFGNVLVIGGSYGKIGAAIMAAKASLRSGLGLVTLYVPKCGYEIVQTYLPEAMVLTDFSEEKIIQFPKIDNYNTLLVGPGLGLDEKTAFAFEQFLTETDLHNIQLVLDADAINLLAANPKLLETLPENTILTPHEGELKRLIGDWASSFDKFELAKKFAVDHKVVLLGKGAFTQTFLPSGEIFFNSTGNPGMATAGSGDVLAGMIAANVGKGFHPFDSALFGVFLHGLAGDLVAIELGEESLMATDIIASIPIAFRKLFG